MNLSKYFTLEELTASQTATRRGLDNSATPEIVENLTRLALELDKVRFGLGSPILISSGYRSPYLNTIVGGSDRSAHMDGRAADLTCPQFGPPEAICRAIIAGPYEFDQLILEFDSWVHFAIAREGEPPRRQFLRIQ